MNPPKAYYYCYSVEDEPLFTRMKQKIPMITFVEGPPSKTDLETWHMAEPGEKILVLDDMMSAVTRDEFGMDLFTTYAHHYNFFTILISQNAFLQSKNYRTVSLNTSYMFIFSCSRDLSQLQCLGRQIFPNQVKYFMDAYKKATAKKYGYLLIDLSPHSDPQYKLRSNILPGQLMTVYLPEKTP